MREKRIPGERLQGRLPAHHRPGGRYQHWLDLYPVWGQGGTVPRHCSIYTRFGDKEGLFRAIVEPAAEEMRRMFLEIQENFHQLDDNVQQSEMGQYTSLHQMELLDYIYGHFDEFRLLLSGAEGTQFARFLDELVDIEVDYTYKYMEVIGCESVKSGLVTEDFIHIIVTAYFNGMFEVVRHNMNKADAVKYVKLLNRYHMQGFSTVFNPAEA